jgi:hypothetical protein
MHFWFVFIFKYIQRYWKKLELLNELYNNFDVSVAGGVLRYFTLQL